ncbi:hypothetical protein M9458_012823, partial [Cirrhinus mrigala]
MNAEALFVMFCAFAEKISNDYACDERKSLCHPQIPDACWEVNAIMRTLAMMMMMMMMMMASSHSAVADQ